SGTAIRVASCRAALQALRWDVEAARAGILMSPRPERSGAMMYNLIAPNISSARPAALSRYLQALGDVNRYEEGGQAAERMADLARIAGDNRAEAFWRQRTTSPASAMAALLARPAYTDGSVTGRLKIAMPGW